MLSITNTGSCRLTLLVAASVALWPASASAEDDVVCVEEHWSLTVNNPNANTSAPQVSMVMSPTGDIRQDYFVITLNHWTQPNYAPGGIQVQWWRGNQCVATSSLQSTASLDRTQETIRWVQRISIKKGRMKFEVVDGKSQAWGAFGNSSNLSIQSSSSLQRLNAYNTHVSVRHSGVSFAGNRVASLTLEKVRWVKSDQEVRETNTSLNLKSSTAQGSPSAAR